MRIPGKLRLILLLLLLFFLPGIHKPFWASQTDSDSRVIRVGWYDYAGFFMMDENGHRSGYAYDYLQEIARHAGWNYEFVEGTVTECLDMLKSGEIDLMGGVMYSQERTAYLNYAASSLGKNYSIITTQADNPKYQLGQSAGFDNILIGALRGDIRQAELKRYAEEQGFTYRLREYETLSLVEKALHNKEVEAILTANMRVSSGKERMIAQFSPVDFFIATSKGNDTVLKELNAAMEQIEFSRKGFQAELSQKYFSVDMSSSLAFTSKERAYLNSHPVIQVALPAQRRPMVNTENGTVGGILPDIMNEIAARLDVTFEYQLLPTQKDSINALIKGETQMIANVYNDYGWAEMNGIFLSRPYMSLDYMAVSQVNHNTDKNALKVAAVSGYRFSEDYISQHFSPEQITWYANEIECIDAVQRGDQDICYVSAYTAAEYLPNYKYHNLHSSMINYSHGLSVGVRAQDSQILLSLIDKALASIGDAQINNIIDEEIAYQKKTFSIGELILRFPVQFIGFFAAISALVIALISLSCFTWYKKKKNEELYRMQLIAERDSLTGLYNRIAYEVIVSQYLQKNRDFNTGMFVMLDIDDFKQINDQNGHDHGDHVLTLFAAKLIKMFMEHNVIHSRMGGDEFSLFFPDLPAGDSAISLIKSAGEQLSRGTSEYMPVRCSIGIAFVSEKLCDFSLLYNAADQALYAAKRNGKNTVLVSDGTEE